MSTGSIHHTRLNIQSDPIFENCIMIIMSYPGYNTEDGLIMNQSAIEKGLFRAQALKKYSLTQKN